MTYVITRKCVGTCDSACVDVCPCDCIVGPVQLATLRAVPAALRGQQFPTVQLFVDPDECIDCGACAAECPADAIYLDVAVPLALREDIARNAAFFASRK